MPIAYRSLADGIPTACRQHTDCLPIAYRSLADSIPTACRLRTFCFNRTSSVTWCRSGTTSGWAPWPARLMKCCTRCLKRSWRPNYWKNPRTSSSRWGAEKTEMCRRSVNYSYNRLQKCWETLQNSGIFLMNFALELRNMPLAKFSPYITVSRTVLCTRTILHSHTDHTPNTCRSLHDLTEYLPITSRPGDSKWEHHGVTYGTVYSYYSPLTYRPHTEYLPITSRPHRISTDHFTAWRFKVGTSRCHVRYCVLVLFSTHIPTTHRIPADHFTTSPNICRSLHDLAIQNPLQWEHHGVTYCVLVLFYSHIPTTYRIQCRSLHDHPIMQPSRFVRSRQRASSARGSRWRRFSPSSSTTRPSTRLTAAAAAGRAWGSWPARTRPAQLSPRSWLCWTAAARWWTTCDSGICCSGGAPPKPRRGKPRSARHLKADLDGTTLTYDCRMQLAHVIHTTRISSCKSTSQLPPRLSHTTRKEL